MKEGLLGSFAAAANDIPSHNKVANYLYSAVGNPARLKEDSYNPIDCGKWIFGIRGEFVDFVWGWIRKWVEGNPNVVYAKVTTARTVEAERMPQFYIEVYTWNADDLQEIEHVRKEISRIGLKDSCAYQKEEAAIVGRQEYLIEEPGFIPPHDNRNRSRSA